MQSTLTQYIVIFVASYLLTALFLLAYKAGLNDLYVGSAKKVFREIRAVHPIALLAAFVSLIPVAVVRHDTDSAATTWGIVGGVTAYFAATLLYRRYHHLKLMDFSIDNGSNFNDEINADPTAMQKVWLFLVSWAGAIWMGTWLGFILSYNSWQDDLSWLTDQPSDSEARIYMYIFLGFILLSLILFRIFTSRKLRKLPTAARVRRAVNRTWFLPALFGLMVSLLQLYTLNTTLTNRYWTYIFFVWIAAVLLWNLVFTAPNLRRHLVEDRRFFEDQQKRVRRLRHKKRKKSRR